MMTLEQLQCAAQRAMIHLNADELPALLHGLQALEPIAAALLKQAESAISHPESICFSAFPDALRPDHEVPSFNPDAILKNAAITQDGCFVVRRSTTPKEAKP